MAKSFGDQFARGMAREGPDAAARATLETLRHFLNQPQVQAQLGLTQAQTQRVNMLAPLEAEQVRGQISATNANRAFDQQLQPLQLDVEKSRAELNRATADRARNAPAQPPVKPPPGYRPTEAGNLEPIPGGPVEAKEREKQDKFVRAKDSLLSKSNAVISQIDEAMKLIGPKTTGFGAEALSKVSGTKARTLAARIKTIAANIAFKELAEMRQNSPTGGALGNVSDKESELLQSIMGSLDQGLPGDELKSSLAQIRASMVRVRNAAKMDEKSASGAPGEAQKPGVQTIGRFTVKVK